MEIGGNSFSSSEKIPTTLGSLCARTLGMDILCEDI